MYKEVHEFPETRKNGFRCAAIRIFTKKQFKGTLKLLWFLALTFIDSARFFGLDNASILRYLKIALDAGYTPFSSNKKRPS